MDLISRRAAINAILHYTIMIPGYMSNWGRKLTAAIKVDLMDEINAIPPAQPWIPVSEGLPDDLAEVNVTWVNHNPEPYYDFIKDKPCTGTAIFYKKQWFWSSPTCVDRLAEYGRDDTCNVDNDIEITAWQELPKPYRGGTK